MPRWYYMREENEYGPLNEEVVRTLMRRGKLDDFSQVKTEGSDLWQNLKDSPLALPATAEVEAALPTEPDIVVVPPIPEAGYTFMPPECALSSMVAIIVFTIEIVLLLALLPTLLAMGLAGDDGASLLPPWLLLSESHLADFFDILIPWQVLLLAIHFGTVIMWHSATADVPPLLGAEVVHHSAGSAWWWAVPGANLIIPLQAVRETWNLSRNPKAWSNGSMSTNPALMLWWIAFLAAVFCRVAQLLLTMNSSVVNELTRADYLRGPKMLLAAGLSCTWIVHLILFIYIVVVIYRRQRAQLKGTSLPGRRRRRAL